MSSESGGLERSLIAMDRAVALEHTTPPPADELFSSCFFRFPTEHGPVRKLMLAHVALPPRV